MNPIEWIHERFISGRRVETLGRLLVRHLPQNASLLEVGAGSGELLSWIATERPDLDVTGIDILVREDTEVPIAAFDGETIPYDESSFDVVMFVDVLHHTDDATVLLKEARRVARRQILIKDHFVEGLLAEPTLRFMDRVGNERFGVALPFNYWSRARWLGSFEALELEPVAIEDRLRLYAFPAGLWFNRSLHFVCVLGKA